MKGASAQPRHVASPSKRELSKCGPMVLAALSWLCTDQHRIHRAQRQPSSPPLNCFGLGDIDSAIAQRRLVCIHVADRQAQRGLVWRLGQQEMLDNGQPALLVALAHSDAAQHKVREAAAGPGIAHRVSSANAGQVSLATQGTCISS